MKRSVSSVSLALAMMLALTVGVALAQGGDRPLDRRQDKIASPPGKSVPGRIGANSPLQATHIYTDMVGFTSINDYPCASPKVLTLNVPEAFYVNDLDVGINLSHSFRGDAQIALESPSGVRVQIMDSSWDSDDHYDVRLDDESSNPLDDDSIDDFARPYYDRTTAPSHLLAAFDSELAQGDWTLYVCDTYPSGDNGDFYRWTLFFEASAARPRFVGSYKTASSEATAGGIIHYTVYVANSGAADAANAQVNDPIPIGVTYVPGSVSCSGGACAYSDALDAVNWLGRLKTGENVTIDFDVQAVACDTIISNTAVISDPLAAAVTPVEAVTAVFCESPLLAEYFEGAFPPAGWQVTGDSGNCVWYANDGLEVTPEGNLSGGRGNFADADSDACGSGGVMDTALWTPALDLSNLPPDIIPVLYFNYDYNDNSGDPNDRAEVDASIDGGLTWNTLWARSAGDRGPARSTIDMSPYMGHSAVTIRFHYYRATYDWWWQVDNVMVMQQPRRPIFEFNQTIAPAAQGDRLIVTLTISPTAALQAPWVFHVSDPNVYPNLLKFIEIPQTAPAVYNFPNLEWSGTLKPGDPITQIQFLMQVQEPAASPAPTMLTKTSYVLVDDPQGLLSPGSLPGFTLPDSVQRGRWDTYQIFPFAQSAAVNGSQPVTFLNPNGQPGLVMTPTANMGTVTVAQRYGQACTNNPSDAAVLHCYDIQVEVEACADVTFYYAQSEANGNIGPSLWHWTGLEWVEAMPFAASPQSDPAWTQVQLCSFSPFVLADSEPSAIKLRAWTSPGNWPVLLWILGAACAWAWSIARMHHSRRSR